MLRNVAETSRSQDNRVAYKAFLELSENQQRSLLNKVRILDASLNILDVRSEILAALRYTTRYFENIYERLEGWWFRKVIEHLSQDSCGTISHTELQAKLYDFQEQFYQDNLPIDFSNSVDIQSDEYPVNEGQRLFIGQLQLVKVGLPRIRIAMSDYYKAYKQRSKWVREDLLLLDELTSYENRLYNEWQRYYEVMKECLNEDDTEVKIRQEGWKLFNDIDKMNFPVR